MRCCMIKWYDPGSCSHLHVHIPTCENRNPSISHQTTIPLRSQIILLLCSFTVLSGILRNTLLRYSIRAGGAWTENEVEGASVVLLLINSHVAVSVKRRPSGIVINFCGRPTYYGPWDCSPGLQYDISFTLVGNIKERTYSGVHSIISTWNG